MTAELIPEFKRNEVRLNPVGIYHFFESTLRKSRDKGREGKWRGRMWEGDEGKLCIIDVN